MEKLIYLIFVDVYKHRIKNNILKLRIILLCLLILSTKLMYAEADDSLQIHKNDTTELSSAQLVLNFLQEQGIPITVGNKVQLLKSGHDKFEDLFQAIREAKHHIHLEYFNFRNDSIANALFDLLAEKAQEGVEVRALFDAFGNWSNNQPLKKHHLKDICDRGIEIVKFDPITFPYVNHAVHRDHRKIVVIDGKIGYTGGMNIADYYIHGLPDLGQWRDMHTRIEGPAVDELQEIFLGIWNKETKQNIGGKEYFRELDVVADSTQGITVAIVDREPKKTPRSISHAYTVSIESAQDYIRIVNPYFVPTKSIKKALYASLKKGVKIEIMASSKADIFFTPDASMYKLHKLMKRGAGIYLYDGGFHHSKIMMVDSTFCTVGTANLNSRSLRYDYETNAFIFDSAITAELDQQFDEDLKNCTQMTPEYWKKRKPMKKFIGWFANLFTPFL